MTYSIYAHIDNNSNTFYIGVGKGSRPYNMVSRSNAHKRHIKKHGLQQVKILFPNIVDKKAARALETHIISLHKQSGSPLVNKQIGCAGRYNNNFKGLIVGEKSGTIVIMSGNADVKSRGFTPSQVNEVINGIDAHHQGYTFSRIIDKRKLKKYTKMVLDTKSNSVLMDFMSK